MIRQQVAGPDADPVARHEHRPEKRKAEDVIEMGVGQEDIDIERAVRLHQRVAQVADAGARVEN